MDIMNYVGFYSIMQALGHGPSAIQLEKQVILNELTYDQALQLANLGERVYDAALLELNQIPQEKQNEMQMQLFPKWFAKAREDFAALKAKLDSHEKLKKLSFSDSVQMIDVVALIDALQLKGWIEKTHDSEWQNYFELPSKSKNMVANIQTTRSNNQTFIDQILKSFPVPGRK